jgi:hypothetical protein
LCFRKVGVARVTPLRDEEVVRCHCAFSCRFWTAARAGVSDASSIGTHRTRACAWLPLLLRARHFRRRPGRGALVDVPCALRCRSARARSDTKAGVLNLLRTRRDLGLESGKAEGGRRPDDPRLPESLTDRAQRGVGQPQVSCNRAAAARDSPPPRQRPHALPRPGRALVSDWPPGVRSWHAGPYVPSLAPLWHLRWPHALCASGLHASRRPRPLGSRTRHRLRRRRSHVGGQAASRASASIVRCACGHLVHVGVVICAWPPSSAPASEARNAHQQ